MNDPIVDYDELTLIPADTLAARLQSYRDANLAEDFNALWTEAGDAIARATRRQWERVFADGARRSLIPVDKREERIDKAIRDMRTRLTTPIDDLWVARVANIGRQMFDMDLPTHVAALSLIAYLELIEAELAIQFAGDRETFRRHRRTAQKLMLVQQEVSLLEVRLLDCQRSATQRGIQGEEYREQVASHLREALEDSALLREQTHATSSMAADMRSAAFEVATMAEQASTAMRDASQTTGGLIRAIEEARSEVESAADVATRAGEQSGKATIVSEALTEHAKSIESILGLIRSIAGQTNLLALNATIEAARAGDAGRGFAVVAQEVKSLANQTARATDDIAAQIGAIQTAARETVAVNGTIRDTIGDVQNSAKRIRGVMENQARTISMITAAVDETAMMVASAADTMGRIRSRTEDMERNIEAIAASSVEVDNELVTLDGITVSFVAKMAEAA